MKTIAVELPEQRIRELCQRQRIRKLALFGSVLRDDFTPSSDVDILIEFEPDERVGFVRLTAIQDELSELAGRQVDLITQGMLSPYFRDEVMAESETIYVAA
jgi:hypothetical protein